jgi:hypothetical protein
VTRRARLGSALAALLAGFLGWSAVAPSETAASSSATRLITKRHEPDSERADHGWSPGPLRPAPHGAGPAERASGRVYTPSVEDLLNAGYLRRVG